ncbi:MAG TPA: GntR family transcriptional regulator [Planctomycetota bacterium]|nr:GntR family transcriptional regulator [Planctomycetota bacterium]
MKLDPDSPVPLYHQLEEILRTQIARKVFSVGGKLPSEHELCREYEVTRPTVRQALESLVREGLITKRHGKGAFVTAPPQPVGIFSVAGTSEAFAAQKLRVETRALKIERVATCDLGEGPDPVGGWVKLERMRSVNGTPTFYEFTWIHAGLVPNLERMDMNNRSLYATLTEHFGLRLDGGKQRFSAVAAPLKVARALELKAGVPLLRVIRSMDMVRQYTLPTTSGGKFAGALRVDLYAAQGPFVLEQAIPARAAVTSLGQAAYASQPRPATPAPARV